MGHRTRSFATSGGDALERVRERPPDLILLDAEMPGKSGLDVCAELKSDLRPSIVARRDLQSCQDGIPVYWVDSIIAPLQRPGGRAQQYISIHVDVTAAKLAGAGVRETHARMALATDAAGIGVWQLDVVTEPLRWDAWMYRLYGQAPRGATLPLAAWQDNLLPEDRSRTRPKWPRRSIAGVPLTPSFASRAATERSVTSRP